MARHGIAWSAAFVLGTAGVLLASGARRAAAPVPPGLEIEVLDPNVDPTGKPAVVVRSHPNGGRMVVDIPETVLVHRYFYTGDRSFQAQLFQGGPVIVVATHPKTGERVYVPVMLPPGAPRVSYTPSTIRYDFGPQSVTLVFGLCGDPKVHYSQATVIGEHFRNSMAGAVARARELVERTGVRNGIQQVRASTKEAVGAAADRVNDIGRGIALPLTKAVGALPGAELLKSSPETQAVRAQERLQRLTEQKGVDPSNVFIPRGP